MTLKIIMQNEKPNQKRMHIVWFHLIKFQKIPSIFTEKEKKKKEVYVPGKEDGRRNELQREMRKVWAVGLMEMALFWTWQ